MRPQQHRHLKQIQSLSHPLSTIRGIGPKRAVSFSNKGIHTVLDLLFFTPLRYEDRTSLRPIAETPEGTLSLFRGTVVQGGEQRLFPGRTRVFKILLQDASGRAELLWFHYRKPHLSRIASPGMELFVFGTMRMNRGRPQVIHPEISICEGADRPLGFYPVYPFIEGISRTLLRTTIQKALDEYLDRISDPVPESIMKALGLPRLNEALRHVHFPPPDSLFPLLNDHRTPHHRRLLFDRFFLVMLAVASRRKTAGALEGAKWAYPPEFEKNLSRFFRFTLTGEQEKACLDVLRDLVSGKPMNRLVLGDVGCGKTAVAVLAAHLGVLNHARVAVMAPSQVLANQHFDDFSSFPREMGFRPLLLTGALNRAERQKAYEKIRTGSCNVLIGTQSLIQDELFIPDLGLVVIDEQQRFGVRERALMDRKGETPHQLVMTATPIPRTLAMTIYGDLDISEIREYPAGRKPVLTRVVASGEKRKVLAFLRDRLSRGQQAFVICPVIEESEERDLKSAMETAAKLKKILSPAFRIGLMHGRLPSRQKDAVMGDFRSGRIHVLVSTTVVEVGVHVPAAAVMIIEHPERFGLSQLHQLRGRVGRGSEGGVCLLMVSDDLSEKSLSRLRILTETRDGHEIARRDLEGRGPGELIGMRQAGLGELDLWEMMREPELLFQAKKAADALLEADPELSQSCHRGLRSFVQSIRTKPIDL